MDRGSESNEERGVAARIATFRADLMHARQSVVDRLRRGAVAVGVVAAMLGAAGIARAYGHVFGDLPEVPPAERMAGWNRDPGITFLDRHGQVLATRGPRYGDGVELSELPGYVPLAFLAAEDRRFRRHGGVDLRAVARAAWVNLTSGRTLEGASTLTQQLAREMLLNDERSLKRKIQEAALAWELERRLGKDGVLELYLERVYLGRGAYGLEAAARAYFDKPAAALTLREASLLAALPKAPSGLDPARAPDAARRRADLVLARMRREDWIGEARTRAALREPLRYRERSNAEGSLGWAFDQAAAEARRRAGADAPNLVVRLTIDPALQAAAERAVAAETGLDAYGAQAALVALGPDGAVRALIGGRNYATGPYNRAAQARRQPGSAVKPFVWAAALEAGVGAEEARSVRRVAVGGWRPADADFGAAAALSLEDALAASSNTVAVRLAEEAGPARVAALMKRFGMTGAPERPRPSLALGAYETTLLELTGAYQAFQGGGRRAPPYLVAEIATSDGRPLWRRGPAPVSTVYDPARAGAMTRMLAAVVERGTGRAAAFGRPAAGKTGTSQDNRDAWFVGFTPDWAAGVWVGNDDGAPMPGVTGGGAPAAIWARFMAEAHAGLPARGFGGQGPQLERIAARQGFYETLTAEFERAALSAPR